MSGLTFRDYVDRGTNVIHEWLHSCPVKVRQKINVRIIYLSTGVQPLGMPNARLLHGSECEGLLELRIEFNHVQYRPIGYCGPSAQTVTLLLGAIEKNNRLPNGTCTRGRNRMANVESDPERYTCEHNFD